MTLPRLASSPSAAAALPRRMRPPLWRRAVRQLGLRLFRWAENNEEPAIERNGEAWLLRELCAAHVRAGAAGPLVVFDAGANVGDYTRAVLAAARAAGCPVVVHAFEPSPACVATLQRDFSGEASVRIVPVAL